jgi:hypothetical protein
MLNRIDQDHRLLGHQLILRGTVALDGRLEFGHVESHITNDIVRLRRPKRSNHQEPL